MITYRGYTIKFGDDEAHIYAREGDYVGTCATEDQAKALIDSWMYAR